jgi:hypothetical protein
VPSSLPRPGAITARGIHFALLLALCSAGFLGLAPDRARAQEGGLIVTEIHCDPRELSDEVGEWIEIYNPTDEAIDLRGWSLEDRRFDAHQIRSDDPLLVQPGAYVVLARRAEILQGMGLSILYAYGDDFILDDVQDEVLLIDENGVLDDGIAYDRSKDWPGLYGHSMEWMGKGNNQQPGSWQNAQYKFFAGDYGSPGTKNGTPPLGEAPVETKPKKTRHSEIYAELLRGDLAPESAIERAELGPPPADKENLSWVLRFGARVQVSNDVGFLLRVPFAAGNLAVQEQTPGAPTLQWSESSDGTMGNPFLGVVFNLWGSNLEIETGVHMPIAADSSQVDKKVASLLGMATDYVTGAESFAQDAVPVSLYLRHTDILPTFFFLGGEAAMHVWFPTDQRENAAAFFQYGVDAGVDIGLLRGGVAAVGRIQTRSGSGDELEKDFVHEARAFAELRLGPFHPGVEYRRPVSGQLQDLFDACYLVRLGIELP